MRTTRQYGGREPNPRPQDPPQPPRQHITAQRSATARGTTGNSRSSGGSFGEGGGINSWLNRVGDTIRHGVKDAAREYRNRPVVDDSQYNKSLNDFLASAQQILSGRSSSAMTGYANQEATLKQNAADATGRIGGGYGALSAFIDGQVPKIQEGYQTGIQGTQDAATQAQKSITEGTAAAQAQQQAIMSRLGIADANIPIANAGTTLESGMANRVADSAQNAQSAETLLNSFMGTGLGYNTAMGTSAALEGQGQKNRVNQDLASRLAEIADARTATQNSSSTDAYSLAQDLMNNDYQQWAGNYDRRAARDQTAYERAMNSAPSAPDLTSTSYSSLGPVGQAQYALQQTGVDADQAGEIITALNSEYSKGGINNSAEFVQKMQQVAAERGLDPISTANAASIYYNYFSQ